MLKAAGSILVLGACTLLGASAAWELEASYQELLYLKRLIEILKGEIQYSRAALSYIFLKIAQEARKPYDEWFRDMSTRIDLKRGGNLADIWRESVTEMLCSSKLPLKERQKLSELGSLLGDSDLDTQMNQIKGYLEQLEVSIQDVRSEMGEKKKLFRCLGIIGGMLLTILLV